MCQHGRKRPSFWVVDFPLDPHVANGELRGASFIRAQAYSRGPDSHDLITSQKPYRVNLRMGAGGGGE